MVERKYKTKSGKVLTGADIDALSDEAEKGYDVEKLRRRPGRPSLGQGPSEVVPVRLDSAMKAAVEARARAGETSTSDVIREAIRRFIA